MTGTGGSSPGNLSSSQLESRGPGRPSLGLGPLALASRQPRHRRSHRLGARTPGKWARGSQPENWGRELNLEPAGPQPSPQDAVGAPLQLAGREPGGRGRGQAEAEGSARAGTRAVIVNRSTFRSPGAESRRYMGRASCHSRVAFLVVTRCGSGEEAAPCLAEAQVCSHPRSPQRAIPSRAHVVCKFLGRASSCMQPPARRCPETLAARTRSVGSADARAGRRPSSSVAVCRPVAAFASDVRESGEGAPDHMGVQIPRRRGRGRAR